MGSYLLQLGPEPTPLHWKYGVLSTRPPVKSQARPFGGISDSSSYPQSQPSANPPLSPSPAAACPCHHQLSPWMTASGPLLCLSFSTNTADTVAASVSHLPYILPKPCEGFPAKASPHPARPSTLQPGSSRLSASSSFPSQAVLALVAV